MQINKEEILHIAKLANINIEDEELEEYMKNLEEILNFADVINNATIEELNETLCESINNNVFRKDEVITFEDISALLENAEECELNMFKIPKVI